jgi:hypothetical protein
MRTLLGIKVLENLVWCGLERAGPQNGFAMDMATGLAPRRALTGARQ